MKHPSDVTLSKGNQASVTVREVTEAQEVAWFEAYPEAYAGSAYKASNWKPVGWRAGDARHRADLHGPHDRPKRLWGRELGPQARRQLRALHERLCAAGKPSKLALTAGLRKRVILLNHVLKNSNFAPAK